MCRPEGRSSGEERLRVPVQQQHRRALPACQDIDSCARRFDLSVCESLEHWCLPSLRSQRSKERPNILDQLLRLFRMREVAARGHDGPALEIVILLGPAFRRDQ